MDASLGDFDEKKFMVDLIESCLQVKVYRVKWSSLVHEICEVLCHRQKLSAGRFARHEPVLIFVQELVTAEVSSDVRDDDFFENQACNAALGNRAVIPSGVLGALLVYRGRGEPGYLDMIDCR